MKLAILCAGGTVVIVCSLLWLMTQVHYRIGSRHLKVMLFGVVLRKFSLEHIVDVSKREPKGLAEHWPNCFKKSHRMLTLELKEGFRKHVVITPRHRYVFLGDLKAAIRRVDPSSVFAKNGSEDTAAVDLSLIKEEPQDS